MQEDLIIKQTSFFNLKGNIEFIFKEEGIQYNFNGKQTKQSEFFKYGDFIMGSLDFNNRIKTYELYYLVIGTLFGFFGIISGSIFFITFSIALLFLHYKNYEDYICLFYTFLVKNDGKKNIIINEIKERIKNYRFKNIVQDLGDNTFDYEKDRIDILLKNLIISQDEYDDLLAKIEISCKRYEENEYSRPKYFDIIEKLLKEKGISGSFEIDNYTYENKSIPGGFNSFSGILRMSTGDKYKIWFDWNKEGIDPETNENGYYTLGDSKELIEKYGKSFFKKI